MQSKYILLVLIPVVIWSQALIGFSLNADDIIGAGAVLMDQETGEILFDKNGSQPMYPASTTKVLTALIILEDLALTDVVTIDAQTPFSEGSRIYLIEGEQVTVEQLLYAMMLASANDAAVALAKHHSGTVQAFTQVMNHRAKALGATDSNFVNPNGLPDPAHVSSAKDLALITRKAMADPTFHKIVSTVAYDLPPTNKQPENRHFQNGNRLLHGTGWRNSITINNQTMDIKWELADGVKTGYTTLARQCLISSATLEGRRVIAAVLKSEGKDIYKDARLLLQHGLEDYKNIPVITAGDPLGNLTVTDKNLSLPVTAAETLMATLPSDFDPTVLTPALTVKAGLSLPISKGQIVGEALYEIPGREPLVVPVKADTQLVDKLLGSALPSMISPLGDAVKLLLKGISITFGLFLLWRCYVTWKRLKKRKRLQQLKARAERNRSYY